MATCLATLFEPWAGLGWPIVLGMAFGATVILAVAGLGSLAARRAAAAVRHRVWMLSMAALLIFPLVCLAAPYAPLAHWIAARWPAEPAAWDRPVPAEARASYAPAEPMASPFRPAAALPAIEPALCGDAAPPRDAPAPWPWRAVLVLVWMTGVAVAGARWVRSWLSARRLLRAAAPLVAPDWVQLLTAIRQRLGLRRRVSLVATGATVVPLTAGWLRPVIVLPRECDGWEPSAREAVLVHELHHVAGWDALWQMVARAACALYWYHPLVWWAGRRMRVEREIACDDAVLVWGQRPSRYASLLVETAASLRLRPSLPGTAVAMASPTVVEQRVRLILQPERSRGPLSRPAARRMLAVAVLLLLAVALLNPFAPPRRALADLSQGEAAGSAEEAAQAGVASPDVSGSSPTAIGGAAATPPKTPAEGDAPAKARPLARPGRGLFSGRVLLEGQPRKPGAGAKLTGVSRRPRDPHDAAQPYHGDMTATADAEGRFQAERWLDKMLLYAQSADGKAGAVVQIGEDDAEATIVLRPLASARGRLVDAGTRRPLPGHTIEYAVRIVFGADDDLNAGFNHRFGGSVTTDAAGRFVLPSLAVGARYHVNVPLHPKDAPPASWILRTITAVVPPGPGPVDLGDVEFRASDQEPKPTLDDQMRPWLYPFEPFAEKIEAARRVARQTHRRVLVAIADADVPACRDFYRFYFGMAEGDQKVRPALGVYRLVSVGGNDKDALKALATLAEARRMKVADLTLPVLMILDEEGRQIAARHGGELSRQGNLDGDLLVEFLRAHAPAQPDAK